MVIFARLFGLYSCLISRVRPVHSFFEKKSILDNPSQIFTNLFFHAYFNELCGKTADFNKAGKYRINLLTSQIGLETPVGRRDDTDHGKSTRKTSEGHKH